MRKASPHRKRRANHGGAKDTFVMVTRHERNGSVTPILCPDCEADKIVGTLVYVHDDPDSMMRRRKVCSQKILINAPDVLPVRKVLRKIRRQFPENCVVVSESQWKGMISISVKSHADEIMELIRKNSPHLFEVVTEFCNERRSSYPTIGTKVRHGKIIGGNLHGQRRVKAGHYNNGTRCM